MSMPADYTCGKAKQKRSEAHHISDEASTKKGGYGCKKTGQVTGYSAVLKVEAITEIAIVRKDYPRVPLEAGQLSYLESALKESYYINENHPVSLFI